MPECFHIFNDHPNLQLQELTREDISKYVEDELVKDKLFIQMNELEEGFAQEVKTTLVDKSSGVFLWIVLVVRQILIGLVHYEDRGSLIAKIDELPNDLEHLYNHMFSKMNTGYQREGSMMLQIMSRAQEVQTPAVTALQFMLTISRISDIYAGRQPGRPKLENEALVIRLLAGRLRSRCCGLIEIQERNDQGLLATPKVMFLHRTVYDYLRMPDVWQKLLNICDIAQKDKDYSLLVVCTHLLEYWNLREPNMHFVKDPVQGCLLACIQYVCALNSIGDSSYIEKLFAADQNFRVVCSRITPESTSRQREMIVYNDAWRAAAFDPPVGHRSIVGWGNLKDPDYFATQVALQLGLISFVKRQVSAGAQDRAMAGALLMNFLKMLLQVEMGTEQSRQCTNFVADLMTEAGIDPNTPCHKSLLFVSVDSLSYRQPLESYWAYWLCSQFKPHHRSEGDYWPSPDVIKVTLQLLEAGATTDASDARAMACQKHLIHAFRKYRCGCDDLQVMSDIDRILRLLKAERSSLTKTKKPSKQRLSWYLFPWLPLTGSTCTIGFTTSVEPSRSSVSRLLCTDHAEATATFCRPSSTASHSLMLARR